ncbi:diguanylate cyclase [Alteromonas genovensis]|uniref:diguanylate cyclase n=1 Tax=Alteromonas genovensis TaxID=471225 RepID=A0A6N9TIC5_9ALTE|nr:GGDEF domain-containing protein [Alteromonas genovensis]NDW15835.1 diguanylate cyclase [Alteromonas genovensis]
MEHSFLRHLLKGAHKDEAEARRRRLTLYFISYVGGTLMAIMAGINVGGDNPFLIAALAVSATVIYLNVIASHIFPHSDVSYYVAGLIVLFTFNALIYTGGYNNTGLYFLYPLIFVQIIVVSFRPALLYVAATMMLAVVMLFNQHLIYAQYAEEDVSRFLISMGCFICVAFIAENFWHQSRKEMLEENLERTRQANTDPLTKLPNRRFLEAVYFEKVSKDPVSYFPLSTVVVDIDHFKVINDSYGHDVGDEVLIQFTEIMKSAVRTTDIVARTGGEEFLVIFPKATLTQAVKLAEIIRAKVEAKPFDKGDIHHKITASFGVATALTDGNINATLKQADDNLYQAKNSGRNKVV